MNTTTLDNVASASGTFRFGGDLDVVRLGFGAMRITGPGIWGPPKDHDEAIRVLRRTRRARHHLHRHRRLLRPQRLRGAHRGGAAPVRRRPGDRHQGRADPAGAEPLDRGRAAGVPPPAVRAEPAQARGRPDRPVPAAPHRPRRPRWRTRSASSRTCRTRARSGTSACPRSPSRSCEAAQQVADIVSVQNRFSLGDRASQALLDHCTEHGIGFIPWRPVADHVDDAALPGGRGRTRRHRRRRSRWPGCCTSRP